jgi:hypothetical protein
MHAEAGDHGLRRDGDSRVLRDDVAVLRVRRLRQHGGAERQEQHRGCDVGTDCGLHRLDSGLVAVEVSLQPRW